MNLNKVILLTQVTIRMCIIFGHWEKLILVKQIKIELQYLFKLFKLKKGRTKELKTPHSSAS